MAGKPNNKVAETIKSKYGENYYRELGRRGGKKSKTGGFYHSKVTGQDWHIEAGRKGGSAKGYKQRVVQEA